MEQKAMSNEGNKARILLVEDNLEICGINCEILESAGYQPYCAHDVAQAREWIGRNEADLIVLDEILPDGRGTVLCKELREAGNRAPILFLTCMSSGKDEIAGLLAGGDDYLSKPYRLETFLVRIQTLLRRVQEYNPQRSTVLRKGGLVLELLSARATIDDQDLLLSPKDFAVLYVLVQNYGEYLSREKIYQEVWKAPMLERDSALKSSIYRLRKQLESYQTSMEILGSREKGYCFIAAELM